VINNVATNRVPHRPLWLLVAAFLGGCAPACDIIAAGTFEHIDNPRLKASLDSTEGLFPNLSPYRLLEETDEVEARLGVGFGFQYALTGFMERKDVTATIHHPPLKDENGKVSTGFTTPWKTDRDSITWWFDRKEDLVAGEWTLQLEHEGRPMCGKTFRVGLRSL
jgi:hypothetical protein